MGMGEKPPNARAVRAHFFLSAGRLTAAIIHSSSFNEPNGARRTFWEGLS